MSDVRFLLDDLRERRPGAEDRLIAVVYEHLHGVARQQLANERRSHTLQPTALVHEAWIRLAPGTTDYGDRERFLAAASTAIRRVLIDHARRRNADRRGGGVARIPLESAEVQTGIPDEDVLAIDEALSELQSFAPEPARIVELRFFGGLSIPEIAALLEISVSTAERRWRVAKAWLKDRLKEHHGL